MLTVLSPAKTLNLEPQKQTKKFTQPVFLEEAKSLVDTLQKMSQKKLGALMSISENLAELNHQRYSDWTTPFTIENAKQSVLTFNGDVYDGLNAAEFKAADLKFAQDHLRMLSGLYGILRPLDLMQAYRLEMGTDLKTRKGKNLYDFWGTRITDAINAEMESHTHPILVNLASNEYFKSVQTKQLVGSVVSPVFKEVKDGKSRTIALFAKRARGRMAAWMIKNRINAPKDLTEFNEDGYKFLAKESDEKRLVFSRKQPPPVNS